ncbi:MAG: hypothetical protein R6U61_00885, partial [Thermoplasmata archaeon]
MKNLSNDRRKKGFAFSMGILIFLMGFFPLIQGIGKGSSPYYDLVYQDGDAYVKIFDKSKAEARVYVWDGTSGADDYHISYVYLKKEDSSWEIEKVDTWIDTSDDGDTWTYNNDGIHSPFPRDGGDGYDTSSFHTAIGGHSGAYVDVGWTQVAYKDFDVTDNTDQWDFYWNSDSGETNDWDGACHGGVFDTDDDLPSAWGWCRIRVSDG